MFCGLRFISTWGFESICIDFFLPDLNNLRFFYLVSGQPFRVDFRSILLQASIQRLRSNRFALLLVRSGMREPRDDDAHCAMRILPYVCELGNYTITCVIQSLTGASTRTLTASHGYARPKFVPLQVSPPSFFQPPMHADSTLPTRTASLSYYSDSEKVFCFLARSFGKSKSPCRTSLPTHQRLLPLKRKL